MISECSESLERSFQEIDDVLELAKLNPNELMPITQTIYFSESDLHHNNFKLLQLDSNLLKEIKEGQTLILKGEEDENVVLCTRSKTYDISEAETSNSLLLMNGMKFKEDCKESNERKIVKVEVHGTYYDYLEATPGKPYVKKLERILNSSLYKGPEHESEVDKKSLLTFNELDSIVQSSTEELRTILSGMDIVTIDNKMRLLDFEYHFRVLSYMLKLIDENSWQLDEIDFEETINSLKDIVPKDVLVNIFEKYTEESKEIDGQELYSYKEIDVCKFFAKVLLSQAGKFSLDEFLEAWGNSVPEGMVPDETMLYGIAIIDRKISPNGISSFSETSLPENIIDRFKVLFELKEKWTIPEITPYIKKLETEKLDVNALLAKYARASKVDGVKYYCAKHCR